MSKLNPVSKATEFIFIVTMKAFRIYGIAFSYFADTIGVIADVSILKNLQIH